MDVCTTNSQETARAIAIRKKEEDEANHRRQALRIANVLWDSQQTKDAMELRRIAQEALAGVEPVYERDSVKRHTVDIILHQDDVALFLMCFEQKDLAVWVMTQTRQAVEHCPNALATWLRHEAFGKGLVLANIAAEMVHFEEGTRLSILQGGTDNKMHNMVRVLLDLDPDLWRTLSPVWIGAKGSPLRELATTLGWHRAMLPTMLFAHIWREPEPWIEYLPFPYSITVCKWILDVEKYGALRKDSESYFVTSVAMVVNADAFDVALAQALLQAVGVQTVYRFSQHPGIKAPGASMMLVVAAVLGMYNIKTSVEALMDVLCLGELGLPGTESYSIDQLV